MKSLKLSVILVTLESGGRPKGGATSQSGDIYSVGAEHLDGQGGFNFSNPKLVTKSFFEKMTRGKITSEDILLVKDGATTGKVSFVGPDFAVHPAAVNEHVFVLRVDKHQALPKYVFYYLQSPLGQQGILTDLRGATVGGISREFAEYVRLPLPPLPEQRRLAAILDAADALRAKRRAALAKLEALGQAVFLEMFGEPVGNERGWPEARLADLADIVSGVTKGQRFNGKPTVFVPYMRVANVQDGQIDLAEVKTIEALESDAEKYRLQIGDILLTEGGDPDKLGRGAIWHGEIETCIHQNHIFRVRLTSDQVIPEYVSALISSQRGKRYFLKAAKQTTGIATINKSQLGGFSVLLPPIEQQVRYQQTIEAFKRSRERYRVAMQGIEELFGSLQQRAFRGEL